MASVYLATCAALPQGDEDAEVLIACLGARHVEARWQAWNDPDARWDDALVVLRSTWDYTDDRVAFLDWARRVPRLANPAPVVEWNSDKTYLRDLENAGVPTVTTSWVAPGDPFELPAADEFVVKPSVGAGSRGAGRFASGQAVAAQAHIAELHVAGCTAMVQPYLPAVDTHGETALIYLAGRFSHAVSKGAMLPPGVVHPARSHSLYVEERIQARPPSAAEHALGEQLMEVLRGRTGRDLLYARVDLLPGPDGPVVVELELSEPSLFLGHADAAADRFAAAIAERV
ncbi:MAG: ATP-grasp domain-containing protein [Jatrophihabitantaceae bacterium]